MILKDNTINIRLAGDGTNIANNLTILNFNFGFLDRIDEDNANTKIEKTNPNTANGCFLIGIYTIKEESYEEIKESLEQVISELSNLKEITIDNKTYNINYFLGGDLKFIASVLGLSTNFAKCNNPCPLCHVDKKNFNQFEISAEKTRKIGDFENPGQIREPIINFVPLERVIIDPLHLENSSIRSFMLLSFE